MRFVNIHEAKTQLSRLIKVVEAGEEVVIQRDGKAVVKLVLVALDPAPRVPGAWAGQVVLGPGFDAPLSDEELAGFGPGAAAWAARTSPRPKPLYAAGD